MMNDVKDEQPQPQEPQLHQVALPLPYTVYYHPDQIGYTPEAAFKEGLGMVRPFYTFSKYSSGSNHAQIMLII